MSTTGGMSGFIRAMDHLQYLVEYMQDVLQDSVDVVQLVELAGDLIDGGSLVTGYLTHPRSP